MINIQTRKACSEILEVLKYIPKEYYNKIPKQVLNVFERESFNEHIVKIDKQQPINRTILSKETMSILAMLSYQYWCPNEQIKQKLYEQYRKNEEKYQQELSQKYDISSIFEERNHTTRSSVQKEDDNNLSLVEYKQHFITKIINKIKKFFHII